MTSGVDRGRGSDRASVVLVFAPDQPMQDLRVACAGCGAHRNTSVAPRCLVCGSIRCRPVAPTQGDLDAIAEQLLAAAELVDIAIAQAGANGIGPEHPAAVLLKLACRRMARARAGRLS